ncbi:MAG: TetR/AcrR family transcriptional regulator [Terracidiphilus sp.]|jgi:AcrR family transcriptional regulator
MFGQKSAEKSITEVRLVEAAAQLFARHGFKATTTREIAQLANLNEITLFRYFPRKPDLFLAAMESHLSRVKLGRDLQLSLADGGDPQVVLPQVVMFVLNVLATQPELQHLLHVAGFEMPESHKMIQDHLGPIFDLLVAYFKRSVEMQIIPNVDPTLAALGLVGIVIAHQTLREFFTGDRISNFDPEQAIAAYVDFYLDGLRFDPDRRLKTHESCALNY